MSYNLYELACNSCNDTIHHYSKETLVSSNCHFLQTLNSDQSYIINKSLDILNCKNSVLRSRPPQYHPSVDRPPPPPPIPLLIFKSQICFPWLYNMTPLTAVFQYRRYFASPESGSIGGVDCTLEASQSFWKRVTKFGTCATWYVTHTWYTTYPNQSLAVGALVRVAG